MKQLKKISFESANSVFQSLDTDIMRKILGGQNVDSDCIFHCLAYLSYQRDTQAGMGPNDDRFSQEMYYDIMKTAYYDAYQSEAGNAGVDSKNINSFVQRYYDTISIDQNQGFGAINSAMSTGAGVIMTIPSTGRQEHADPNNPKYHAVILKSASARKGSDGQVAYMIYNYYDPQTGRSGSITIDQAEERRKEQKYGSMEYNSIGFLSPIKNCF